MAGQVGWKTEATVGTPVVVDTFVPVLGANLSVDEGYMRPDGIRAGRRTQNPALLGRRAVSGSVSLELPNVSLAALLKHLFGAVTTAGAGPYTHTYTPGPHLGKSVTMQIGVEDSGGTVRPFTASGTKFESWELSCSVGEFAQLSANWTAKDVVTATGLATASYAAGLTPFTFVHGSVTVNGAAVASAKAVTLSATKGLVIDRHVLGSRLIREQLEKERFEFSTEVTADFDDFTLFALQVAATQVASVLTFNNGTDSLVITCSGQVVGDPPSLTGNGLEEQTIRLDHSHATTDASAITAVLTNTEASAA